MHGVSKITSAEEVMMISYTEADALFMTSVLSRLADSGVVVDMISQTAPSGKHIRFSFSAPYRYFEDAMRTLGAKGKDVVSPMISGGYTKVNLFGQEMVESVGVAARALSALNAEKVEVTMLTTSDLDISLLVRQEDADVAIAALRNTFEV